MAHNVSGFAELFGWRGSCSARDVTAGKLARRPRSGRRRQPGSYLKWRTLVDLRNPSTLARPVLP